MKKIEASDSESSDKKDNKKSSQKKDAYDYFLKKEKPDGFNESESDFSQISVTVDKADMKNNETFKVHEVKNSQTI